MKTSKFFFGAAMLCVGALAMVSCNPNENGGGKVNVDVITTPDVQPTDGAFTIVVRFDGTVCRNDDGTDFGIGFPCSEVMKDDLSGWSEDPSLIYKMERVETDVEGNWFKVVIPTDKDTLEGKPVQLAADGSFSWDYQTGAKDSWTVVDGEVEVIDGYADEANLKFVNKEIVVFMVSKGWKKNQAPCVEAAAHHYKITLKMAYCGPEGTCPGISGGINDWGCDAMTKVSDTEWTYEFDSKEGQEYKFQGSDGKWSNEIMIYSEEDEDFVKFVNQTLGAEENIVFEYTDQTKYVWSKCGDSWTYVEEKFPQVVFNLEIKGDDQEKVFLHGPFVDASWNGVEMTKVSANHFTYTLAQEITSGTEYQYTLAADNWAAKAIFEEGATAGSGNQKINAAEMNDVVYGFAE